MKHIARTIAQIAILLLVIELVLRLVQHFAPPDNPNIAGLTLQSLAQCCSWRPVVGDMHGSMAPWSFALAIWRTILHAMCASVIAVMVGLLIGMAAGYSRVLRFVMSPIVDFFRSIPVTLMSVIAVIAFSRASDWVLIILCAIPCSSMMAFMLFKGISALSPERARVFALNNEVDSRLLMFFRYDLPSLFPEIAAGIKLVSSYAIVLACVLEMMGLGVSASAGRAIGEKLDNSASDIGGAPLLMILTLGLIAYATNRLLDKLEANFANHKF